MNRLNSEWFFWQGIKTNPHSLVMKLKLNSSQKIWNTSRICVSSLRRGHANLLCIVPILVYVFRRIQREGMSLCYIYPQHSAGLQIQVQSQTKVDSKKNTDEAKVWERSLDSYFHLRIYYRINHIYTLMIYPALFVHFCKDWCLTSICKSAYWPKNTVKKDVTIEIWTHNYQIIIQHPNQKPFSQNWITI